MKHAKYCNTFACAKLLLHSSFRFAQSVMPHASCKTLVDKKISNKVNTHSFRAYGNLNRRKVQSVSLSQ